MNDSLPTIWPAEPHTLAKHAILREYLRAWMPIMVRAKARDRKASEVLFVDGFAGPGVYSGGEEGSPVIAVKAAMDHEAQFPLPIRFIFIELCERRHAVLKQSLVAYRTRPAGAFKVRIDEPIRGDCNTELSGILTGHEQRGTHFGPALIFLDQFGYSAVPVALIAKIMKYPSCEVFSYLDYKFLNRFITDQTKHAGIDAAFGGDEWREAINLPQGQREKFLLARYRAALISRGGVKYASHFAMHDSNGQLLYWLFFCTGHLRGLEEMKGAMWKVDKTGTFRFSDSDTPDQPSLFLCSYTQDWLAEELSRTLNGQEMTGTHLKEHVLTKTPCVHFREALSILERANRLVVPNRQELKQRTGFPEEMLDRLRLQFVTPQPKKKSQPSLFGWTA